MDPNGYSERGLHGTVVHTLGEAIARGVVAEGELLDPRAIGERFSVSRTVVREAFRVLAAKGLVEARPRTGTRVENIAAWNLLDRDVIVWRAAGGIDADLLGEYLELRLAIEPRAAALSAARQPEGALEDLRAACAAMRDAIDADDGAAWLRADIAFHQRLLTASGNRLFAQLGGVVAASLEVQARVLVPDGPACEQHELVAEAIERGDLGEAEAAARHLLDHGMHNVEVRFQREATT